jgi:hypothetical protein
VGIKNLCDGDSVNLGGADRLIRLFGGLSIVIIDFIASGDLELALLALSAWGVLTSAFGWCPFYRVGGINTCPIKPIE